VHKTMTMLFSLGTGGLRPPHGLAGPLAFYVKTYSREGDLTMAKVKFDLSLDGGNSEIRPNDAD
jgi:hypothetical protein